MALFPVFCGLFWQVKHAVLGTDELLARSVDELRDEAERLERDVTEKVGPA